MDSGLLKDQEVLLALRETLIPSPFNQYINTFFISSQQKSLKHTHTKTSRSSFVPKEVSYSLLKSLFLVPATLSSALRGVKRLDKVFLCLSLSRFASTSSLHIWGPSVGKKCVLHLSSESFGHGSGVKLSPRPGPVQTLAFRHLCSVCGSNVLRKVKIVRYLSRIIWLSTKYRLLVIILPGDFRKVYAFEHCR